MAPEFKKCPVCDSEFKAYHRQNKPIQLCCSKKCSGLLQRKRIECTCEFCGKIFEVHQSHIGTKRMGRFCSMKCTHDAFKNGSFSYGTSRKDYIDAQGYKIVGIDGKHKREHRLVMEKLLGRQLLPTESVHHINNDRSDNRVENLEVWSGRHPVGFRDALIAENLKLKTLVSQLRTCVEA